MGSQWDSENRSLNPISAERDALHTHYPVILLRIQLNKLQISYKLMR